MKQVDGGRLEASVNGQDYADPWGNVYTYEDGQQPAIYSMSNEQTGNYSGYTQQPVDYNAYSQQPTNYNTHNQQPGDYRNNNGHTQNTNTTTT